MKGAREYAELFKESGQEGKLVWVVSSHARGKTFRIFVLPEGETAHWITAFKGNQPLNKNTVEVYGVVAGQPGWTEEYGWIHQGKWQEDFDTIYLRKKAELAARIAEQASQVAQIVAKEEERINALLKAY